MIVLLADESINRLDYNELVNTAKTTKDLYIVKFDKYLCTPHIRSS